jgi:hypothetical protein
MNKKALGLVSVFFFLAILAVSFIRRGDPFFNEIGFGLFRPDSTYATKSLEVELKEAQEVSLDQGFLPLKPEERPVDPNFDDSELKVLEGLILVRKDECHLFLRSSLPEAGVLSADDMFYQRMQEELLAVTADVITSFVSVPSQQAYAWIYDKVIDDEPLDPFDIKDRLDNAEVCYDPLGLSYLQVLLDAADFNQWPRPVREAHGRIVLRVLHDEILNFPSSTNLLFALSSLRSFGQAGFVPFQERDEVDGLISRVIEQFERGSQYLRSGESKDEARSALRDLMDENDLLRQQARDLLSVSLDRMD